MCVCIWAPDITKFRAMESHLPVLTREIRVPPLEETTAVTQVTSLTGIVEMGQAQLDLAFRLAHNYPIIQCSENPNLFCCILI